MCFAYCKYVCRGKSKQLVHSQNSRDRTSTNSEGAKLFERHLAFNVVFAKGRVNKRRAAMCEKNAGKRAKCSDPHATDSETDAFVCDEVKQSRKLARCVRAGRNRDSICAP